MTEEKRTKLIELKKALVDAYVQTEDDRLVPEIEAVEINLSRLAPATDEEIAYLFD